jgi:stage II sporulation protein M
MLANWRYDAPFQEVGSMTIAALFRHFKEMGKYFVASVLVFVFGMILGYRNSDQFSAILQSQMQGLEQLARMISEKENETLWMFGVIFVNNAVKSILVVFSGIGFGLFPLLFLILNAMILGYLAETFASNGEISFFLKGILPHGIIEIPVLIIACAYGIKYGAVMAKGLGGLVNGKLRNEFSQDWSRLVKVSVPLAGFLVMAMLVAAIIESTVTPWLVGS